MTETDQNLVWDYLTIPVFIWFYYVKLISEMTSAVERIPLVCYQRVKKIFICPKKRFWREEWFWFFCWVIVVILFANNPQYLSISIEIGWTNSKYPARNKTTDTMTREKISSDYQKQDWDETRIMALASNFFKQLIMKF